jgi:DNA-binding TFAR19-related protein (PDSD5 family)
MINNQRYSQVVSGLIQLNQSKRLEKKISDKELKKLLEKLSEKKEITIKRK